MNENNDDQARKKWNGQVYMKSTNRKGVGGSHDGEVEGTA